MKPCISVCPLFQTGFMLVALGALCGGGGAPWRSVSSTLGGLEPTVEQPPRIRDIHTSESFMGGSSREIRGSARHRARRRGGEVSRTTMFAPAWAVRAGRGDGACVNWKAAERSGRLAACWLGKSPLSPAGNQEKPN